MGRLTAVRFGIRGRPRPAPLRLALGVGVLGLLTACTGVPVPTPGPPVTSSVASATPTPSATESPAATPTPTPTPTAVAPLGKVATGKDAALLVQPVDYDGVRIVNASLGSGVAGRPVSLQRKAEAGWQEVAAGTANDAGRVEFRIDFAKGTYRAVAAADSGEEAVATPEASADKQWRARLADDFDGTSLKGTDWDGRNEANYTAGGRACSAAYLSNVKVSDGSVRLRMTEETKAANQRKARAAGCTKDEYYRNAMISTEGRYTIRSGILAARVKFPVGQGMHGSIWLQSYRRSEVDMVESYGYGKGLTSVMHLDGEQHPGSDDAWVLEDSTDERSWWDDYHVVSAQWDANGVVVRVDGAVVQRIRTAPAKTDYFLVVSLLSSDWELGRLRKPVEGAPGVKREKLPAVLEIDWIRTWQPR